MITSQQVLFIGSYAPADQPGILVCTFDDSTGDLTLRGSFAGIVNPSYLLVHPNGHWLYSVSETSQQKEGTPGAVWALRFTRESWSMEPINQQMSGGDLPCHLEINATGQWLLVSNYGSGTVSVLPVLPDGSLGEMTDLVQHEGSGPNPDRQDGPHAHSATFTPDQRFVIETDGSLVQLAIRPCGGQCPRNITITPSGRFLLVANQESNEVVVLPVLHTKEALGAPVARISALGASCIEFLNGRGVEI